MDTRTVLLVLGRIVGAALLAGMAAIHVYLWMQGYRDVPTIGLLFLLNGIGGGVLCLAVLFCSGRLLAPVSAVSAVFTLGTLGALVMSLTIGLLGFHESLVVPFVPTTLWVESAGVLELAALTAVAVLWRPAVPRVSEEDGQVSHVPG